ncbi:MAG: endonuclease VII domain-containing protein [Actinomycetota bacterium]|nr:endonuclease VII domain-containing protein [Actinomycetota bacterium]
MKRCKRCGELKPLSAFYRAAGMRDGHRNDCKVCNLAEKKRRYDADPAAAIARVKRWQQENADRLDAYRRTRREDPAVKRAARAGHLKRKYGITIEQYEAMLALQGGTCAICRRPPAPNTSLHVDHDHETGEIRGLLCFTCNNFLGDVEEDLQRLRAAAGYLEHGMEEPELEWAIRERVAELKAFPSRSK